MKYDAFIWDYDGTLFNSYPHAAAALCETLAERGISVAPEDAEAVLTVSLSETQKRFGISDEVFDEFRRRRRELTRRPLVEPFHDAAEVLRAVCAAGGRNFLYTHSGRQTGTYLRAWGLDKYFSGIVDAAMHFPLKPAPDAILYLLKAYGADPARTVMIGDREIDVLAARAAGVAGCLFLSHAVEDASAARHTASDMRALARELEIPAVFPDPAETDGIREAAAQAARELCEAARLETGALVAVGCSSSEIAGEKIGAASSPALAQAVAEGLLSVFRPAGIGLAAQCCEHLNRALIVERAHGAGYERVNVFPMPKAGGSFAYAAWKLFDEPLAVRAVQADAGLDIGGTLIGMHLRPVAVPLRLSVRTIGAAPVTAARVRPPFVGGERALYDGTLL